MFSLTEKPPKTFEVRGKQYPIDTSYDNILTLIDLLEENYPLDETLEIGLGMIFKRELLLSARKKALVFRDVLNEILNEGETPEPSMDIEGNPMPMPKVTQHFSYKYDAKLIYSAFMQAYGIDLIDQQGQLEWAKFRALLMGLPSSTRFKEVLDIRQRPYPKGKGTEKERAQLRKLKKALSYPGSDFSEGGEYT